MTVGHDKGVVRGRRTNRVDRRDHYRWYRRVARRDRHPQQHGILVNVVLGVIGAGLASWLFGKLGIQIGGPNWVGYLVAGFVGACILILATRIFYPDRWRT